MAKKNKRKKGIVINGVDLGAPTISDTLDRAMAIVALLRDVLPTASPSDASMILSLLRELRDIEDITVQLHDSHGHRMDTIDDNSVAKARGVYVTTKSNTRYEYSNRVLSTIGTKDEADAPMSSTANIQAYCEAVCEGEPHDMLKNEFNIILTKETKESTMTQPTDTSTSTTMDEPAPEKDKTTHASIVQIHADGFIETADVELQKHNEYDHLVHLLREDLYALMSHAISKHATREKVLDAFDECLTQYQKILGPVTASTDTYFLIYNAYGIVYRGNLNAVNQSLLADILQSVTSVDMTPFPEYSSLREFIEYVEACLEVHNAIEQTDESDSTNHVHAKGVDCGLFVENVAKAPFRLFGLCG